MPKAVTEIYRFGIFDNEEMPQRHHFSIHLIIASYAVKRESAIVL
jgi:hypothetical protein